MPLKQFVPLVLTLLAAQPLTGQTTADGPAVQLVVTAEPSHGKDVPVVNQSDVTAFSGKTKLEVMDWQPATGDRAALQLFLLMDDSSSPEIGTQFGDLRTFLTSLPASTQVALGYMRNGTVLRVQDFTSDHSAAAAKLRLPLGSPGANGSPYFAVSDLIKTWPSFQGRREILMISDGVDRYYGGSSDNPYVRTTFEQLQRAGIILNSIYWSGAGHSGHNSYLINWGQNYLAQISEETGGEAYWQGFGNPVSFAPFLEDFSRRLNNQYILTVRSPSRKQTGPESIRVHTELPKVDLVTPAHVWVPGH